MRLPDPPPTWFDVVLMTISIIMTLATVTVIVLFVAGVIGK